MKKTLFLVTSAIRTSWSKKDVNDITIRYFETVNTINSINANVKHADIWILESSVESFGNQISEIADTPNVKYISFTGDPEIKKITSDAEEYAKLNSKKYSVPGDPDNQKVYNILRSGYIKSMTESYVVKTVIDNNNFEDYGHVVKISGRYCISPLFDIQNFLEKGMYVFDRLRKSDQKLCNIDYQYRTVIWSFCTSILDDVKKDITKTRQILDSSYKNNEIIDLEHAIFEATKYNLKKIKNITKPKGLYGRCDAYFHTE
jgi:hypothetical protein